MVGSAYTRIIVLFILCLFLSSCASGPSSRGSHPGGGGSPGQTRYLRFTLRVGAAGSIDGNGRGSYVILLNGFLQPIEVTNSDTFTDFIRYDGFNFDWYHRQDNVPGPGYTFLKVGNVNQTSHVGADGKSLIVTFNVDDSSSLLNQYILTDRFAVHVVTTDNFQQAVLGRALDTLGPGPDMSHNTEYTLYADKFLGIIAPKPPDYPKDPLGDYVRQPDLPGDFPFENFDLELFQIESY